MYMLNNKPRVMETQNPLRSLQCFVIRSNLNMLNINDSDFELIKIMLVCSFNYMTRQIYFLFTLKPRLVYLYIIENVNIVKQAKPSRYCVCRAI